MATKTQARFFLVQAIRPALQSMNLWTSAAEELLLGTAIVESDLLYRKQLDGGPARGLFQMEPLTHDDIWSNFLKYRPDLVRALSALMTSATANKHLELEQNDKYASALVRVHYLRTTAPLPRAGDNQAMAKYWKAHYNTWMGQGKESKYLEKWYKTMGSQK